MEIERKIACKYLRKQYERAKKWLGNETKNDNSVDELNKICERVRRAGIAYAQARYCVFTKYGYGENVINRINGSNKVIITSQYKEFVDEIEKNISAILNQDSH